MARLLRKIAPREVRRVMNLLSVAVVWLAHGLAHADEPIAIDSVPPSPSSDSTDASLAPESSASSLWRDRPLGSLKATISSTEGELPTNAAAPRLAEVGTRHHSFGDSRPWMLSSYEWEAPATRHLPLLFEEPNLERLGYAYGFHYSVCGYETGPRTAECLQPVVSGVRFFGRIPFMPYMWGYQSPCEPVYTLGVDRPGSPVCYRKHRIPLSLKGAVYQAAAVTGLIFYIP